MDKKWKWLDDLDAAEKAKADEVLARHPNLLPQSRRTIIEKDGKLVEGTLDYAIMITHRPLAWDGVNILAHERPPTQAHYFQDDDGNWTPKMQEGINDGSVIDTGDGGFLMLVPVAK
jgi:hypothetical protein